jgi:thymidylate synthase ThyX
LRATAEIFRATFAEPQCSHFGAAAVFGERTKIDESFAQSSQRYS